MDANFKFTPAGEAEPVRIEQVFAEKPGGGVIKNPQHDLLPTTAVGQNADGSFSPIKGYRLTKAVAAEDTSIQIAKGSGVATGDIIGFGGKAVACTAVEHKADYDEVTVTMGVAIAAGSVLYQAKAAKASNAEPIHKPVYVTGNLVEGGNGDKSVRLINGANLRKETACIGEDIAALIPTITLV